MTKPWHERLKERMDELGVSQADLCRGVGIKSSSVNAWYQGRSDNPRGNNTQKAAQYLRVHHRWLMEGKGPKEISERPPQLAYDDGPDVGEYRAAPIIGTAQLGAEGYWHAMEYPVGHGDGYVDAPSRDPNAYALRVRGDSMAPTIKSGWIVVVEPNSAPEPGDYVLVCLSDGRCMIKEFLADRGDDYYLGSVNQTYAPMTVAKSDVTRMHFVGFIVPPRKARL